MKNLPVIHRRMKPADSGFIYSTWLKSYRQTQFAYNMSNDTFFHHHKQIIEKTLSNPNTEVTLVCDQADHDHIYGYSVVEKYGKANIIHYVYMKHAYRKLGLTKDLLQTQIPNFVTDLTFVTHESRHHKLFKVKFNLEYNPYILH